jgi:hypothetical protein
MKVVKAALEAEAAPRWGYAAFVSLMLYLVRRAGMKDVAGEVRLGHDSHRVGVDLFSLNHHANGELGASEGRTC